MSAASKANVLLVGSGGVGTMAAYALEKGGQASVTTVLRSNFARVKEQGFDLDTFYDGKVSGWRPSQVLNDVPNVSKQGLPPYDFIVVTTKNVPDIKPGVVEIIKPAVTPGHTTVVLVQNGVNIEKPLVKEFPTNAVISGVSMIGATETSHGCVRQDDDDVLIVGAFNNPNIDHAQSDAKAREFVRMYDAYNGPSCQYDPNVTYCRWRKLLYNATFNSVCTILRLDTSRMRVSEHIIEGLIRPAFFEIRALAAEEGVDLPEELYAKYVSIDPYEAFWKPSMCQDIEKGNYIEFENIVGEPVRVGEARGVPTPTLKVIYELLKGLQFKTKESKGLIAIPTNNTGLKYP